MSCGQGCHAEGDAAPPLWKELIQNLFVTVGLTNVTIQDDEPIMIFDTNYFAKLEQVLNSTSTRYCFWIIFLIYIHHAKASIHLHILSLGHCLTTWVGDLFYQL